MAASLWDQIVNRGDKSMLFNVYYMNFCKVYEIKMMLSNIIKTDGFIEMEQNENIDAELQAKMGIKFLKFFNVEVGSDIKSGSVDSQKVLENFKVITTKSLILNEVMDKCKTVTSFSDDITEGQLVRIDKVSLSLENETELRTIKMLSNGMFKDVKLPEAGGMDINNLFNSMFKDYSYKLKGEMSDRGDKLITKIPFTFENEFESLYSVDDLFVGNVTIIGIYKGKTKINKLKNSFEFFQKGGQASSNKFGNEVHNSQYSQYDDIKPKSVEDNTEYNYIDLLAIVQDIKPNQDISTTMEKAGKKNTK